MVAAVGLVIGPVLGGALVAIDWPWVFWFNVPLGLIGCVWGAARAGGTLRAQQGARARPGRRRRRSSSG